MPRILLVVALLLGCAHARPVMSPDADRHLDRGVAALGSGDLDRAEAELGVAAEYSPRAPEVANARGLVALARGDLEIARACFVEAIREDDDFVEGHANLGAVEMAAKQPESALPHLRAALAVDPGYAPARHNLARALTLLGRTDEARAEYLRLTSVAPDDADAWAELAAVERKLGHPAGADRAAVAALERVPNHSVARRVETSLLRDGGALDEALVQYDEWLERHPSDAAALADRAVTLVLLGRSAQARHDAERAVALAPQRASAHFALGVAATDAGDHVEAVGHFARAIALAAEEGRAYPEAEYLAAKGLVRLGRRHDAAATYRDFLDHAKGRTELGGLANDAASDLAWLETPR